MTKKYIFRSGISISLPLTMIATLQAPALANTDTEVALIEVDLEKAVSGGIGAGLPDRNLSTTVGPALQLLADSDDATVQLSWEFAGGQSAPNKGTGKHSVSFDRFKLVVATELAKGSKQTDIFGLSGFSGGTEISLNYTHFWGKINNPTANKENREKIDEALKKARDNCKEVNAHRGDEFYQQNCNWENLEKFTESASSLIANYNGTDDKILNRLVFPDEFSYYLGGKVSANQTEYDFLDRVAFKADSKSKFGYSATAFVGALSNRSPSSFGMSFTYKKKNKAKDEVTVCQPIPMSVQSQCITGADGLPKTTTAAILGVEGRHAFGFGAPGTPAKFAIAPELNWDFKTDAYSINVPVYFAPNKDGALRGGVRFGYTSTKDALGKRDGSLGAVLFVGLPFGFFTR